LLDVDAKRRAMAFFFMGRKCLRFRAKQKLQGPFFEGLVNSGGRGRAGSRVDLSIPCSKKYGQGLFYSKLIDVDLKGSRHVKGKIIFCLTEKD